MVDRLDFWIVVLALGVGTYLLRFSFIGFFADKTPPEWLARGLKYVPVTVLPALIAPLILFPKATGGELDPARLIAAVITLLVGLWTRKMLPTILAGVTAMILLDAVL